MPALLRLPIDHCARHRRAFTLIELLAVIAIVGLLAAIVLIALSRMRDSANTAACISNWRQTDAAVKLFVTDNGGVLPVTAYAENSGTYTKQIWYQLAPYMGVNLPAGNLTTPQRSAIQGFMQKKMGCTGGENSEWDSGFSGFLSGKRLNVVSRPARTIYGIDLHGGSSTAQWFDMNVINGSTATKRRELTQAVPKPHGGRVNVLYVDGHVETRLVSSLMVADATRDASNYQASHETTPIGDPTYDQ